MHGEGTILSRISVAWGHRVLNQHVEARGPASSAPTAPRPASEVNTVYLPERSIPPFVAPGFGRRGMSDRLGQLDGGGGGTAVETPDEDTAGVHLQPVPGLEWSLATESPTRTTGASSPAAARCSWLHTAAEGRVLALFRKLDGLSEQLPSPWWLRALAHGRLPDRATAFRIEDEIHAVLAERPGWVFVPW